MRTKPLTMASLWEQYLRRQGILGTTATAVALWPLSFGIWFIFPTYGHYDAAADARARIVQSVAMSDVPASKQAAERKAFANSLLTTYARGIRSDVDAGGDTAQHATEIIRELRAAQQTGRAIKLSTAHDSWRNHPWTIVARLGVLLYVCLAIGLSVRYLAATMNRVEYLAALPWHRGWPFIFVLLTPVLIPGYIVSAPRLIYAEYFLPKEEAGDTEAIPYNFKSNQEAARKLYFDLRFGDWRDRVNDRRAAIRERIAEIVAIARANQRERSFLQAEDRMLATFEVETDAPDSAMVRAEFEAILADPRVHGLSVEHDEFVVFTKSRFLYRGTVYDLGDWAVRVSTRGLSATELRSGVKVAWHTMHPIYRNGDGTFCFGDTLETLNALLAKGALSQAVIIAVEAIHSVNASDQSLVPEAFKVAADVPTDAPT